jgi:hypothetical protein
MTNLQPTAAYDAADLEFPATLVDATIHSRSLSGDREVLAGRSGNENVNWFEVFAIDFRDVSVVRYARIARREHLAAIRIDLGKEARHPAERHPRDLGRANPAAHSAKGNHDALLNSAAKSFISLSSNRVLWSPLFAKSCITAD